MATTMIWGESIAVTMEIGFLVRKFTLDSSTLDGTDVLDGTLDGVFVDPYVQSISISRGRSDQLQNFTAGTATIVLNNNDRRFDPINTASPYWDTANNQTGVVPRRSVNITSGTTVIFTGSITDIDVSYMKGASSLSTVTISAADDFVLLANTFTGDTFTPAAELSGTRVTRILDLAAVGYSATTRTIAAGTATLGAYEIANNTNALSYLQQCAVAEQNYCFISAAGNFTFTNRIDNAFSTAAVSFTDTGSGIGYQELSVIYGQELLYNRVQCTTADPVAAVQTQSDTTSQTVYGVTTLALDNLLLSSDSAASTLATLLLARYKDPVYRFDKMDVILNGLSAVNRNLIVGLELSNTIGITRSFSTGTPSSITKLYNVDGITHTITPNSHTVSFQLRVADIVYQLILDDAIYGVLDSDNALAA